MFKILNVQMDDSGSLTAVLHHTPADSSRPRCHNWLRFRHFHDLASFVRRSILHRGANDPVGSQAPNPVNSHKILNTLALGAAVAPDPTHPPLRTTRPPRHRAWRHRANRETLRGELAPTSRCWAAASPAARPRCTSRSGATAWPCSRRTVGYGASGRSGGQTFSASPGAARRSRAQVGRDDARRLFDLSIEALDLTQSLIREQRIDCDYQPNHVQSRSKPRHLGELTNGRGNFTGLRLHVAPAAQSRRTAGARASARYLGGLIDSRSGHLHPLKYTQGVARAAEAAGAEIFENSRCCATRMAARCACGPRKARVRCAHLVLCGNAYIGAVAPALARRILGVGTYIIATEPLGRGARTRALPSNAAIADINWILDYFRRSADHRLLFGGRVSYSAVQPPHLGESMRRRMMRIFPTLADVKVAYAWGGYLDITMSRARISDASRRMSSTCRDFPATAWHSPASPANWSPKPSPVPRSGSMCSPESRIAISPGPSAAAAIADAGDAVLPAAGSTVSGELRRRLADFAPALLQPRLFLAEARHQLLARIEQGH